MTDTQDNENEVPREEARALPLGYWLRAVDALIDREFASALAAENADRRDWMLLNAVSGDIDAPAWLAARMQGRGGKRLRALAERGWIARTEDAWTLTDEGRAAKARLGAVVDGIRERVSGAVSPEDYATMTASLETIARELGGDESERMHRFGRHGRPGFGRGRGFGPGFRPGFGPAFGPGFGPAFGPGFGPRGDHHGAHEHCGPAGHGAKSHHRDGRSGERHVERAFERGFDAGFRAARERAEAS
jgi:hypothetical protein